MDTIVQLTPKSQFSATTFAVALFAVGSGAAIGLAAVPRVGTVLGIVIGGMTLGVAGRTRPLIEGAVAAIVVQVMILAAAGVPGAGLSGAVTALSSVAPGTLAVSLTSGAAAGGFGAHLGDDLRDGLTTPIENVASRGQAVTPPVGEVSDANQSSPEPESSPDAEQAKETIRQPADE